MKNVVHLSLTLFILYTTYILMLVYQLHLKVASFWLSGYLLCNW